MTARIEEPRLPDRAPLLPAAILAGIGISARTILLPWTPLVALTALVAALAALARARLAGGQDRAARALVAASGVAAILATTPLLGVPAPRPFHDPVHETPIARRANHTLPPALARFTRAVVLNDLEGLEPAVRVAYRRTGLTHLLAISGMNVAIMALLFRAALAPLPMPAIARELGSAAAVGVYIAGIGAPPSALRAGLMAIAVFLARARGRSTGAINILAGAALVTLLWDPSSIRDPGFQLSYAATAGLIAWTRPLARLLPSRPRHLGPLIAGTLAAQAPTLPLVAWHFAELAPIGFLANIATIPIFAVLFPLAVLALAGLPPAAVAAAHLLEVMGWIIEAMARLPGSAFVIERPPLAAVLALLVLSLLPLIVPMRRRTGTAILLLVTAATTYAFQEPASGTWIVSDGRGRIGIIDTRGDGTAVLLDPGLSGLAWKSALTDLGVTQVHRIVATSPAALSPAGGRRLAELVPVTAWNVPLGYKNHPEGGWVLRRMEAAGHIEYRATPHAILDAAVGRVTLADHSDTPGVLAVSARDRETARIHDGRSTWNLRFPADNGAITGL